MSKSDESCIKYEELCIKTEELCISKDEFCRLLAARGRVAHVRFLIDLMLKNVDFIEKDDDHFTKHEQLQSQLDLQVAPLRDISCGHSDPSMTAQYGASEFGFRPSNHTFGNAYISAGYFRLKKQIHAAAQDPQLLLPPAQCQGVLLDCPKPHGKP